MKILSCCFIGVPDIQKKLLKKHIEKDNRLQLRKNFKSVMRAIDDLDSLNVDLIFLSIDSANDINFQVMNHINQKTQVIIISTRPDFAMKAFEYEITDYLLFPFPKERFDKALAKVRSRKKFLREFSVENFIVVKSNLKEVIVFLREIKWVEALGDYVKIVTNERNIIVLSSLKSFNAKLPGNQFLRVHKSYIVNLEMISFYNHKLIEIDGYELPLSRTRKLELDEILKLV